ncbi:hypothetical protein [Streptomyces sp. 8L]|uniref:hypothetical protein n=1 Tax=Streptomyces sp. 8L TaxID=2877242 RepID=UPI001CD600BF|nr:hypothetical protein [Streptomyces sp. 8L]MCA1223467.1 hypothetical protein [Streptomyces sp. 8L]
MTHSKAEKCDVAERRTKLIRLRRAGHDFDYIAKELGYSCRGSASKDLIRALKERRDEQDAEVSVYRQEENERLDALLEAAWPRATEKQPVLDKDGEVVAHEIDLRAVETVLKLMDRRAKLNGYDMPVKSEVSGPDGGGIPLAGTLDELTKLIKTAGQTGPASDFNNASGTGGDRD